MSTVRWSDIRDKHVEAIGHEDVERGTSRLISQVRAHRLADMRKRRGLTRREVAQAMEVTVGGVSQIENGELLTRHSPIRHPIASIISDRSGRSHSRAGSLASSAASHC